MVHNHNENINEKILHAHKLYIVGMPVFIDSNDYLITSYYYNDIIKHYLEWL